ncbi:MAG: hypothetical protein mread185_000662 [Mycoplasmataceae bacterium]|nr:MAG: hypothetical protein mread185_000662 [Mycoplasmataceae bacterium]
MNGKFIPQQERMNNLSDRVKKWLSEVEQSDYQIEDYSYFSEPQGELTDWEEYEKTLNKATVTSLIIKPNTYKFKNNKLELKDYPKLTTIYGAGLGLEKISLSNLPQLQSLNLTDNKLIKVDGLEKLISLVSLVLTKNEIASLDVRKNINLVALAWNRNRLEEFVNHKKKRILNCQGLQNLKYLDCSFSFVDSLNVKECGKLETLDADSNFLNYLNFPYLPSLKNLSLLGNNFNPLRKPRKTLILRSPNLKYLVTRISNIREVIHKFGLNNELQVIDDEKSKELYGDIDMENKSIQAWEKQVDETIANSNELDLIRHLFGDTHIDHEAKEKEIKAQLAKEEKENINPPINDPSKLTNKYPDLIVKQAEEITLTHKFLTKTLIVENRPNLTSLNVGNNYLSYLVVRNCPNLKYLRYAHNKMKHDCFIEDCLQLKSENINKENYQGKIIWDKVGEELFNKGEMESRITDNEQKKKKDQESPQPKQPQPTKDKETPSAQESAPPQQNPWPLLIISSTLIGVLAIGFYLFNKLVRRVKKISK